MCTVRRRNNTSYHLPSCESFLFFSGVRSDGTHTFQVNDDVNFYDHSHQVVWSGMVTKVVGDEVFHVQSDSYNDIHPVSFCALSFGDTTEIKRVTHGIRFLGIQGWIQPKIQPLAFQNIYLVAGIVYGAAEVMMGTFSFTNEAVY